jgi:hypothetical protein
MTGEERNSFERELQKDSFAQEAAEGFSLLSPEDISSDLINLQNRIRSRTVKRQKFMVYRIAASVAVLMVISTLLIVIDRNKTSKRLAVNSVQTEKKQITKELPQAMEILTEAPSKKQAGIIEKKSDKGIAPTAAALTRAKTFTGLKTSGRVLSSEDNLPVPGANILIKGTSSGVITDAGGNFSITLPDTNNRTLIANFIGMESKEFEAKRDSQIDVKLDPSISALSEVVVVGYGTKRVESEKEDVSTGYIPPSPINGKSNFDKYIKENQHRPDTITSGQRAVVVVSFLVHLNGSIDSLRIVRSPGKIFSDEAIRLIKSGPLWKPAEDNGKLIEDEVRIRIVFR